jgi:hypothetical protein
MAAVKKEKKPIMCCASSGHITKLMQSIFAPFDIYGAHPLHRPERERELKREMLFQFLKGMTGALAPFSYLVLQD